MAVRLELHKDYARRALDKEIASLKRQIASPNINPAIRQILEQDLALFTTAANTISETK